MQIRLENEILEKYPEAAIGYLVARVAVKNSIPFVEELKLGLARHLNDLGINATNFVIHPSLGRWRKIYEEDFQINAKTYRSSIEALVRRVVTGKQIWAISSIVDLYNCCSILSLLPMGGYDLKKISGDITIRYAKNQELFIPLGAREEVRTKPNQVVYADDTRIICWLWNHKDSQETCIDEHSEDVVFFIDSFEQENLQEALERLAEYVKKVDGSPLEMGILSKASPTRELNYSSSLEDSSIS